MVKKRKHSEANGTAVSTEETDDWFGKLLSDSLKRPAQQREQTKNQKKGLKAIEPQVGTDGEGHAATAPASTERKKGKRSREVTEKDGAERRLGRKAGTAALSWKEDLKRMDVKHGQFSAAEKEALKASLQTYAEKHGLSSENVDWLYNLQKAGHYGAMNEIAEALPHRTRKAVWQCLRRILHQGTYKGQWSAEEDASLARLIEQHGSNWKEIGRELGRYPEACRDRWKDIKLGDRRKTGAWSPEEVEQLHELVTSYLDNRRGVEAALQELEQQEEQEGGQEEGLGRASTRSVGNRHVLDCVDWEFISQELGTRNPGQCRDKWYDQLSPSMIARGDWGVGDDKRMLTVLYQGCYENEWEVEWDMLVPKRTAAQARRRWRLMTKCVPDRRDKTLGECIDYLVERYCPKLKQPKQAQEDQVNGQGTNQA